MKKILLVLFGMVFLTCHAHVTPLDKKLDSILNEIIEQEWQKHANKLGVPVDRRGSPNDKSPLSSHNCVHREVAKNFEADLAKGRETMKRNGIPLQQIQERQLTNQTAQPIRFQTNTTLLGAADPRACQRAGQQIPLFSMQQNREILYTCTPADILTPELSNFIISSLMPAIRNFYTRILSVINPPAVLQLSQTSFQQLSGQCAPDVLIPATAVSPGIPGADILIFVTARPSDGNTSATGLACNFEIVSETPLIRGRPLAAVLNFVPSSFAALLGPDVTQFDIARAVRIGIHEMAHALGFSSMFYDSYIDRRTGRTYANPRMVVNETLQGTSAAGQSFNKLVFGLTGPTALAFARSHFNCQPLAAIQLEDLNATGPTDHWEKKIAGNELMTFMNNPAINPMSGLTLGLFQDMGWYEANLQLAEHLSWGRGAGCPFVNNRVGCEQTWNFQGYFCRSQIIGCSADRSAKGTCNPVQYPDALDPYYQHFTNPNLGGSDPYADFCPYTQAISFCQDVSQTPATNLGETFGVNSFCFEVGLGGQVSATNPSVACYTARCSETTVEVQVGNTFFPCPADGGNVDISSVIPTGVITCPAAFTLCSNIPVGTLQPVPSGPAPSGPGTGVRRSVYWKEEIENLQNAGSVTNMAWVVTIMMALILMGF